MGCQDQGLVRLNDFTMEMELLPIILPTWLGLALPGYCLLSIPWYVPNWFTTKYIKKS